MFNRRQLLGLGATVAALPILQACGTPAPVDPNNPTPPVSDLSKAQTIVAAISGSVAPLIAQLSGLNGISPATLAKWQADVAQVTGTATDVVTAVSAAAGQGPASIFASAVNALLTDLGNSSGIIPPALQGIIADIKTVLPIAMAVFQVAVMFAAKAPTRLFGAAPVENDPVTALRNLQNFARSQARVRG